MYLRLSHSLSHSLFLQPASVKCRDFRFLPLYIRLKARKRGWWRERRYIFLRQAMRNNNRYPPATKGCSANILRILSNLSRSPSISPSTFISLSRPPPRLFVFIRACFPLFTLPFQKGKQGQRETEESRIANASGWERGREQHPNCPRVLRFAVYIRRALPLSTISSGPVLHSTTTHGVDRGMSSIRKAESAPEL